MKSGTRQTIRALIEHPSRGIARYGRRVTRLHEHNPCPSCLVQRKYPAKPRWFGQGPRLRRGARLVDPRSSDAVKRRSKTPGQIALAIRKRCDRACQARSYSFSAGSAQPSARRSFGRSPTEARCGAPDRERQEWAQSRSGATSDRRRGPAEPGFPSVRRGRDTVGPSTATAARRRRRALDDSLMGT